MTENVAWTGTTFRYISLFVCFIYLLTLFISVYIIINSYVCIYYFQESLAQLQELEEELVDSHKKLLGNLENWLQQDATLLTMTNDVDYDQDGEYYIIYFYCLIFIYLLSLRPVIGGAHRREAGGSRGTCRKSEGFQVRDFHLFPFLP